jgi:hypothetical protein
MRWFKGYMVLIGLILLAYIYAEYRRPPRVDWSITLDRFDRIPYGTYILYESLEDLFETRPEQPEGSVYERYNQRTDTGEVSIIIAKNFKTSPVDEAELLRFLALGNSLFVATEEISRTLADTLGLEMESFGIDNILWDTLRLQLEDPSLRRPGGYPMPATRVSAYLRDFDSSRTIVLGRNQHRRANYILMRIGKGQLFLHCAPMAFSNVTMLAGDNRRYVSDVLSYLPRNPERLLWDDYFSSGRSGASTPLRVILTRPGLRAGYYTALLAIILLLLFRSKRRQRIILVIAPLRNTTMEFVDTVTQLYINKSNHRDIALKMVSQFLEYVRGRFGLPTGMLDEDFTKRLAARSGMETGKVGEIIGRIQQVRSGESVKGTELLALDRAIDEFKKMAT